MFKKIAIGISCIAAAGAAAALVGCGGDNKDYSDKVQIIFELEGARYSGRYMDRVSHYYDYSDSLKITPLDKVGENVLVRDGGYTLEGWYLTKNTDEEGKPVYSDKWDFATDKVSKEGVTLYAKWEPPIVYSFDFIHVDAEGEEHVAASYKVQKGNKFSDVYKDDIRTYASCSDHTALAVYYYDEDGQKKPFTGTEIEHPGGDKSYAVKVYSDFNSGDYVEGSYTLVSTKAELLTARTGNVYLLADIDLEGETLSFGGNLFAGNGFTVSNFSVEYVVSRRLHENFETGRRDALRVAIFGDLENAVIKDVTFENVTVEIDTDYSSINKIYVAPLAVSANNSKFENVTVTGTIGYKTLPDGFDAETDLIVVTDKGFLESFVGEDGATIKVSENSTETNCSYAVTFSGKLPDTNNPENGNN